MIAGIGTDIIEISRIKKAFEKSGMSFLERIFTDQEIAYFKSSNFSIQTISGTFAGKEAAVKAMGTGIRGFKWKDLEILRDKKGKPHVFLRGEAAKAASERGIGRIFISISHCREYAVAYAIASSDAGASQPYGEDIFGISIPETTGGDFHDDSNRKTNEGNRPDGD